MIGIDAVNNVAYVPTGITDASGNATVALVDITPGATKPLIKTLSLPGANAIPALALNSNNNTMLAEGFAFKSLLVQIYEIDTTSQTVKNTVVATGLTKLGRGGILHNAASNQGFVADDSDLGVLDTSKSPPVWDAASVVGTTCSDSLALNFVTGILFMSCDGTNEIIDTTKSPLAPINFQGTGTGAFTDGVSYDSATNIAILSEETVRDESFAFNFATLNTAVAPATADIVRVPGAGCTDPNTCSGEIGIIGEGPGGQAAVNCATHQAVIVDELGQNLKLIQLPVAPVAGALNNNGQPGSGTKPDAASVFTISGTVLPSVGGLPLLADGDPNSLTIYPSQNFAYVRASGIDGKVLVGVDLSKPVLGASAAGCAAKRSCWNPAAVVIPLR